MVHLEVSNAVTGKLSYQGIVPGGCPAVVMTIAKSDTAGSALEVTVTLAESISPATAVVGISTMTAIAIFDSDAMGPMLEI